MVCDGWRQAMGGIYNLLWHIYKQITSSLMGGIFRPDSPTSSSCQKTRPVIAHTVSSLAMSAVFGVLTWLGSKETFVENGRRSDDWNLDEHGFCLLEAFGNFPIGPEHSFID